MCGVRSKKNLFFRIEQYQKWKEFIRLFVEVIENVLIKVITLKQQLSFGYAFILKLLNLPLYKSKGNSILMLAIRDYRADFIAVGGLEALNLFLQLRYCLLCFLDFNSMLLFQVIQLF